MFRNFTIISEFEFRALINDKSSILRVFLEPLAYLFLLAPGLQGIIGLNQDNYISFVYPGIVALQLLRLFMHSIYRLTIDRRWGLQAIKMNAGTTSFAYILGMSIVPICLFLMQAIFTFPFAVALGVNFSLTGFTFLLLMGVVATLFWVSVAIICTYYFKKYSQRDLFIQFLFLPLSLSAPVFYSLEHAPNYLKVISMFNPLSYQVTGMREYFLNSMISVEILVPIMLTIVTTLIAFAFMRNAEYLPSET